MSDEPNLLDLLSGEAEKIEQRVSQRQVEAERRAEYRRLRATCPDGRELGERETWCGRCGETISKGQAATDHDLGYCGCPVEVDPTWKRYPRREDGRGWRGHGSVGYTDSGLLEVADLCDRWDRQHFPDCTCGHPWGLHEDHDRCLAWCGCRSYGQGA